MTEGNNNTGNIKLNQAFWNGVFICLTIALVWWGYNYIRGATHEDGFFIKVKFEDIEWSGVYQLKPYNIWDGATRWSEGMYVGNDAIQVVSFQIKKRVPIGRGGMILTDSKEAFEWFKYATYDGRNLRQYYMDDEFAMIGWHMYMTPEDAARGIMLMDSVPEVNEDTGGSATYSDLSEREVFKPYLEKEIGFKP